VRGDAEEVHAAGPGLDHEGDVETLERHRTIDVEVDPGPGGPTLPGGKYRWRLSG
jgi:hypothetical protein